MEAIFLEVATNEVKIDSKKYNENMNTYNILRHAENFTTIGNCKIIKRISGETIPKLIEGEHFYFDDTNEMVRIIKVMPTSNGNIAYIAKNVKIYESDLQTYLKFIEEKFEEEKRELNERIKLYEKEFDNLQYEHCKLASRTIFGINVNRKFLYKIKRQRERKI